MREIAFESHGSHLELGAVHPLEQRAAELGVERVEQAARHLRDLRRAPRLACRGVVYSEEGHAVAALGDGELTPLELVEASALELVAHRDAPLVAVDEEEDLALESLEVSPGTSPGRGEERHEGLRNRPQQPT